ncbi:MAG TPA: phosphoribosyl-AMP cyclohydrolase [Candidatus Saccharimonadales bacterium]|nr:phosphoribosyl-AMP cyclohydrolase [Candidatus Saccharimonadales bacterium]
MKDKIDFEKSGGLVPAVIQDSSTGEVYMLGYMNEEAYEKTRSSGWVYFWSRSKNRLWMKGEESGNKLKVVSVYEDCDYDTLLIKVELKGEAVCHTGNKSCFYQEIK